jgi:hypothetical protein
MVRTITDTATLSDATSKVQVFSRGVLDASIVNDLAAGYVTPYVPENRGVNDNAPATDSVSRIVRLTRTASDTTSVSDSAGGIRLAAGANAVDNTSLSDIATARRVFTRYAYDVAPANDFVQKSDQYATDRTTYFGHGSGEGENADTQFAEGIITNKSQKEGKSVSHGSGEGINFDF